MQGATHVTGVAWSPNDDQIATYGDDGFVQVWDAVKGTLLDTFVGNKGYIETALSFSLYGGRLAYGGSTFSNINALSLIQAKDSLLVGSLADGAIQMVVPTPSFEKLKSIARTCGLPTRIEQSITAHQLQTFTTQVTALTDAQIPAGCKADLLAVAEALEASNKTPTLTK